MSSFSQYLENKIVEWLCKASDMPSSPATVYLALSTADPLDDASGIAEPSGGYARQSITFGTVSSTNGVGTSVSNNANVVFPIATGDWGSITHGALYDAASGGNMLSYWQWTASKLIETGDTWVLASGDLTPLVR